MKLSALNQIRSKVVAVQRGVVITLSIANEGSMISLLRSATRVSR